MLREIWETDAGRSPDLRNKIAEQGLTGLSVPEEFGGLALNVPGTTIDRQCGSSQQAVHFADPSFRQNPRTRIKNARRGVFDSITIDIFQWLVRIFCGLAGSSL